MTDQIVVTGTPPETGVPPVTAAPPVTPAPAAPWFNDFKDAPTKEWLTAMNGAYPDPESVAMKAYNLEKFLGADKAGRGIVLPKDGSKPEEFLPIFRKLGASDKIDDYKVDAKLATDPVVAKFRENAVKTGMPVAHFNSTLNLMTELATAHNKSKDEAFEKQAEADINDLKAEWTGTKYDQNVELARRAAKTFLPHADETELTTTMEKIEGALGTKAFFKLFSTIGAAIGEHSFHDGDGPVNTGMTVEGAKVRIDALRADRDFGKKLASGDTESRAEWDKLHKIAFPGQSTL